MRIIYFDIDCLRPDHLGCYGYNRPTSPVIDSIAKEGTVFQRAYCASSPCLPSRTSLVSGQVRHTQRGVFQCPVRCTVSLA